MADTSSTIAVKLQGVDNASQTIEQVKNKLNGLQGASGSAAGSMSKAFSNLADQGIKQATSAVGPLAGGLAKLGPIGVASSLLLVGAMKRYKYEIEETRKALEDQRRAQQEMADIASKEISNLERKLALRKQLRQLDDDIAGADAVQKAKTSLANIDDEIATVKKELEEAKGIQKFSLRQAGSDLENIENVRWGHAIWWKTGTETANEERYKNIEAAQKRSVEYTEKIAVLQDRLKVLAQQRELAEKNITDEQKKQAEEQAKISAEFMKRLSTYTKALAKGVKEALLKSLDAAKGRLAELIDSTKVEFSGLYSAGSHETTKLLASMQYAQSGTGDIPQDVASILTEIREINARLAELEVI